MSGYAGQVELLDLRSLSKGADIVSVKNLTWLHKPHPPSDIMERYTRRCWEKHCSAQRPAHAEASGSRNNTPAPPSYAHESPAHNGTVQDNYGQTDANMEEQVHVDEGEDFVFATTTDHFTGQPEPEINPSISLNQFRDMFSGGMNEMKGWFTGFKGEVDQKLEGFGNQINQMGTNLEKVSRRQKRLAKKFYKQEIRMRDLMDHEYDTGDMTYNHAQRAYVHMNWVEQTRPGHPPFNIPPPPHPENQRVRGLYLPTDLNVSPMPEDSPNPSGDPTTNLLEDSDSEDASGSTSVHQATRDRELDASLFPGLHK